MVSVKLGEAFVELRASLTKFQADLSKFRSGLDKGLTRISKRADKVGKKMSISLTAPLIALATASTRAQNEFGTNMNKIVSLVGIAEDKVNEFRKEVLALSGPTAKAPAELAEGLFFITSAGLRGKKAMDALTASAKGSAIGLGATKVVADAATSAVNAYAKSNLQAEDAVGILAAGVREGKAEADAIARALGRVLGIAATTGVRFDEVTAAIAAMTRVGVKAEEAVTGLRSILNALIKSTPQQEEAIAKVGLSFEGLRRQLREEGLLAVLIELGSAFDGNAAALSEAIPSVEALSAFLNLVGENAESTKQVFESLSKAGRDDLAKSFDFVSSTAEFKLSQSLVELGTVMTRLGSTVLPIVVNFMTQVAGIASTAADAFSRLSPETRIMVIRLLAIGAAVGPLVIGFSLMVTALRALVAVMVALASPVVLITTALAALGFALSQVVTKGASTFGEVFEGMKEDITSLLAFLQEKAGSALDFIFGEEGMVGGVGELDAAMAKANNTIDQLTRSLGGARKSSETTSKAIKEGLADSLAEANLEARILAGEFGDLEPEAIRAAAAAGVLQQAVTKIGEGEGAIIKIDSALVNLSERMKQVAAENEKLNDTTAKTDSLVDGLGLTFVSAFEQAIDSGASLDDIFKGLLRDIQRLIIRTLILEPLLKAIKETINSIGTGSGGEGDFDVAGFFLSLAGGAAGGTTGSGAGSSSPSGGAPGGRAAGGPLGAGQLAVVGEKGPELFAPDVSGNIIPNDQAFGPRVEVVQNIQMAGLNEQMRDIARRTMAESRDQMLAVIRDEARTGSSFKEDIG